MISHTTFHRGTEDVHYSHSAQPTYVTCLDENLHSDMVMMNLCCYTGGKFEDILQVFDGISAYLPYSASESRPSATHPSYAQGA